MHGAYEPMSARAASPIARASASSLRAAPGTRRADRVTGAGELVGIGGEDIHRYRHARKRLVQGVPRLAPVVDPLEHDEQVDVAFLPTVSTRAGAEEEDLEWMELADERVDRLVVVPKKVVHPGLSGGWWLSMPPAPEEDPDEASR
jgi:hypothetical protein